MAPAPAVATRRPRFISRTNTVPGFIFDVANFVVLGAIGIVALLPLIYLTAGSFATETEISSRPFFVIPHTITFESYRLIFGSSAFLRSIAVSVGVTVVGTAVHLFFLFTFAYPLSKKAMPGRNLMINLVLITLVFGGGLIPTFLVVKALGLIDTYWALILPGATGAFALIVIKNFFQELPPELEESAKVDGASEIAVLWHILLPLSKPILATFALFSAVGIWNDYMSALLYLNKPDMWPLQMFLRQVTVAGAQALEISADPNYVPPSQGIKFAVIVVATLPVLLVYPFLQKHFAKGMLIGSVKG